MADRRGGYRQPERPAAVSNPQSGARTDGGAGSKSQPIRVPSGGKYGERKAAEAQQAAAPMAAGGPAPAGSVGGAGTAGGASALTGPTDVFGPTTQPNIPSGAMPTNSPRQMAAENPDYFLRVLYSQFPTAAIGALLRRGGTNG
jgi:hypothetical protein